MALVKQVILSDGLLCDVQILSLYFLDHIGPADPGDFTYRIKTLLGEVYDQIYPLASRLENPPPEPKADEDDTWILTEHERFQAALHRNQQRIEMAQERALNVAHFIIDNCLGKDDRQRIITPDDYDTVYNAALTPEVKEGDLARILQEFFRG